MRNTCYIYLWILLLFGCGPEPKLKSERRSHGYEVEEKDNDLDGKTTPKKQDKISFEADKKEEANPPHEKNEIKKTPPPPQPAEPSPPTNTKVGFILDQSSRNVGIISVTFNKNGESKTFEVLDGKRIKSPFKMLAYVNGAIKDFTDSSITDVDIGKEIKHLFGGSTWAYYKGPGGAYIYTSNYATQSDPLVGQVTLLWDTQSDIGKWIIGSNVSYRHRATSNRGQAKITLIGPYSKQENTHSQKGDKEYRSEQVGNIPID